MTLRASDFDYDLPADRIAQTPAARREDSRLLHLDRKTLSVRHGRFSELPELLDAGDLLVLNDTQVVPARFHLRRRTGGRIEALFLRTLDRGAWQVLLGGAGRCKPGETLDFEADPARRLRLVRREGEGRWIAEPDPPADPFALLAEIGTMPLPPYIRRGEGELAETDRKRYQTVYARRPGAVAAPTAGLHFTPELLDRLPDHGVGTAFVTLHVGLGTFLPVKVDDPARHTMHTEWFELSEAAAERIRRARCEDRRVVAVGTTVVRVLETVARAGEIAAARGRTDIFLYPPTEFPAVDALITNFHLPRSTLLMLVAAFCDPGGTGGIETILETYREAIAEGYRFYSYGDAMLIT